MTRADAAQQEYDAAKQIRRLNLILLAVFVVILATPPIGAWWVSRQLPVVNTVSIENVRTVGSTTLCAGEPLVYRYDFHAGGSGVLIRDRVIWRLTPPPKTMIFSISRRFILSEPIDQDLTETWHIPNTFHNPETDMIEPLPPGDYRMIFAISSPSRSTVVSIGSVDFSIVEDCQT